MVVSISLPSLRLSEDEKVLLAFHLDRLSHFTARNKIKAAYYEGRQRIKLLGITIPPSMRQIETVVGWPGTTVDVLDERLDWLGWTSANEKTPYDLDTIYADNQLAVESGLGNLDTLIYGTAFVIVGSGDAGEPNPLVTVESPFKVTGDYDGRTRRLKSALSVDKVSADKEVEQLTLYLPNVNIVIGKSSRIGGWSILKRDEHNLGRVLVAQLTNRPRASRVNGRSEITRAIRSYTDQGVRTMLGMSISSEFFSSPQRYLLNADEGAFADEDGHIKTGWEALIGAYLAVPANENGDIPQIGQFSANSPAPYLEQLRGLAQLVAAEAGIPSAYLGFVSDNPASADAIRAAEARLIKRAERRALILGQGWHEVGALGLLVRDKKIPVDFNSEISERFRDPATPTRSAAADEATKLVGAGILTPDSKVTYDRVGLTAQEQKRLDNDKRKQRAMATVADLRAATAPALKEGAPDEQGSVPPARAAD